MFDHDEFATYIAPLLKKANQVSEISILLYKLKTKDKATYITLIIIIVMFVAILMYEFGYIRI